MTRKDTLVTDGESCARYCILFLLLRLAHIKGANPIVILVKVAYTTLRGLLPYETVGMFAGD